MGWEMHCSCQEDCGAYLDQELDTDLVA
jgi:hypothetical protein